MSDKLLAGWKVPIPTQDFCNFVMKPLAVEPGKRNFFETKDSASNTGHSLRVRARMTFAGLPTENHAVYLPDEMYKGISTWTSPFARPVQKHHDDGKDPVGRVIDARYIDTTAHAAQLDSRITYALEPFADKKSSPKARMAAIPIFQSLAKNEREYRGVGHTEGLWNITDPDAIQKILDGRLLTISTSFVPQGAYCSSCAREGELTDWRHQSCDHERGEIVDGLATVAIPFGFENKEVSFVNDPAAKYARVLEAGENISFADAIKRVNYPSPYEIFLDPVIVSGDVGYRFSDSATVEIPENFKKGSKNPTEKDSSVIGSNEQYRDSNLQGSTMKFADLIKNTESNYQKIVEHLSKDAPRLAGAFLAELEDSAFAGPNRTFPVRDLHHCEAIKQLMATVEDSDAKADLLEIVEAAIVKLASSPEDAQPEQDSSEASVEADKAETSELEVEPEQDSVSLPREELEALKEAAARAVDLEASRDMLKQRVASLKTEIAQLEAANTALIRDQKESLADKLLDAQIAGGFKITDKAERISGFMKRSVESLKDSISDLQGAPKTGMANEPSGQKVDNPLTEQDSNRDEPEADVKVSGYEAIFDRYFDISFGPGGQRAADEYLRSQKRLGYLPAHVNP